MKGKQWNLVEKELLTYVYVIINVPVFKLMDLYSEILC